MSSIRLNQNHKARFISVSKNLIKQLPEWKIFVGIQTDIAERYKASFIEEYRGDLSPVQWKVLCDHNKSDCGVDIYLFKLVKKIQTAVGPALSSPSLYEIGQYDERLRIVLSFSVPQLQKPLITLKNSDLMKSHEAVGHIRLNLSKKMDELITPYQAVINSSTMLDRLLDSLTHPDFKKLAKVILDERKPTLPISQETLLTIEKNNKLLMKTREGD